MNHNYTETMDKKELDEALPFRTAIRYTGYYESKFYHPEIRALLEANGAVYAEKPALSTFPKRALLAAGLIDDDGNSTKKARKPRESSQVNRQYYSRLPYSGVEQEIDKLTAQLEEVRESLDPAQAELDAATAALEAAKARRDAATNEITRLNGSERSLVSNLEYLNARGYDLRAQLTAEAEEARAIADQKAAEAAAAEAKYGKKGDYAKAASRKKTKSDKK
jgi:chromosome segregation ATPase